MGRAAQPGQSPAFTLYPYARVSDQSAEHPVRHPVVIIGAGPVGLSMALDLVRQGIPVLLLDEGEGTGDGSRAICFSKRTLEIAHRYGCAAPMVEKGVVWSLGRVFQDDRQVFEFNLQPETGHRHPAFINLQQPYVEAFLFDRLAALRDAGAPVEIRGRNRVTEIVAASDGAKLTVETPDGVYTLDADWVIACDGASSPMRKMLGLDFEGRVFRDNFLIADIAMTTTEFPTERWFWFDPHFKSGDSTLLHRQPDNTWRVDFQIGWDIDRDAELKEANIRKRLDAMLGPDVEYQIVWSSIYTFQCRRLRSFRHGRVLFAGDSAHQVSPFGARGANSGFQDVDNLGWKLGLVLAGAAPDSLLDSYDAERTAAADENILNSTRSTDFITPKTAASRGFRDAVLKLAETAPFARPLVNSGRLSVPCTYDGSPLNGPDALAGGPTRTRPGSSCPDAPLDDGYLLDRLGDRFILLALNLDPIPEWSAGDIPVDLLSLTVTSGPLAERYLGTAPHALYLIRPDQHIAARWSDFNAAAVASALRTVCGKEGSNE